MAGGVESRSEGVAQRVVVPHLQPCVNSHVPSSWAATGVDTAARTPGAVPSLCPPGRALRTRLGAGRLQDVAVSRAHRHPAVRERGHDPGELLVHGARRDAGQHPQFPHARCGVTGQIVPNESSRHASARPPEQRKTSRSRQAARVPPQPPSRTHGQRRLRRVDA